MVSKGSQSFERVLRMSTFNILPIFVEIGLTLIVFVSMFSWMFLVLQFVAIILYLVLTYVLTERRAPAFTNMTKAD